jgi:hypothetical protein
MSSSPKLWLQASADCSLSPVKRWNTQPRAWQLAPSETTASTEVQHWLERFHCQQCAGHRWWQIAYQPPGQYCVSQPDAGFRRAVAQVES